ncbi:putative glycoside hydrolase family 63 protein [Phaeoacremonium minimum UCRPA7]|uniref:Mannosyl-oligosaccharide glucosidase n=1 Tax=Phaeoacremonium minimum (strain UCR-PA7) TaxID=1286976 RepID=R8BBH3_PHAM7|nr:putative glycoside hydrolase family 63 protein [Phaeoacremonium minimum UCRPA7]EON96645.1 putative glycoside hydrolase family 63 protein [Phaeoacremonium minimum UCRPA7]
MAVLRQLTALVTFLVFSVFCAQGLAAGAADEESILNSEIGRSNNQSLLWGPYRPNLYFGIRPRIPKSLMTGLMWAKVDNYQEVQNSIRYTCEQHEGMAGYGWDEYDTRKGGVQTIHDAGNNIDITTSFVKIPGGAHGGSWAARIKGEPRADGPSDLKTTVIFYVSQDEGLGSSLAAYESEDPLGYDGDLALEGQSQSLGKYKLVVTKGTGDHPMSDHELSEQRDLGKTVIQSVTVPEDFVWQAKPILFRQLKEGVDYIMENYDPNQPPPPWQVYQLTNKPGMGNVHMIQKMFEGPFEFDILYSSHSAGKEVTSEDLTREIQSTTESFGERFSNVFAPKAPFTAEKYKKFGRSMFSNLIGGIGYFYGHSVVDRSYAPEYEEENEGFWEEAAEARARKQEKLEGPYELFSSIPSRPFFPRGFLWDEGFHLMPIADWDIDLTLEIVKSWFNLMDEDGWIAREQILGPEARSKVPEEFQVQYPHYANPPTLFLVIDEFVSRLQRMNGSMPSEKEKLSQGVSLSTAHLDNPTVGLDYLRRLYPFLRRQFDWFKKTQYGDIKSYDREAFSKKEAYRWRGRTERHVLTSGLDDYPRAQPPHPGELHVDLMSWVGLMTKSLINIAGALDRPDEVEEFKKVLNAIEHNLDDLHWSEKDGCYCDATIDDFEEHSLVCHKGYISLFPFLTGLLKPDSPKLGKILSLIGDEEELWSPHGIRSLSRKDDLYGTDENYWRSPVWMNINYLAVTQLYNLAKQNGPHQKQAKDLYTRLRKNLVDTVFKSWEETGFAWEQYNPETGQGQRTQHFTGWTSLVVKIMAMDNLSGGSEHLKDEL